MKIKKQISINILELIKINNEKLINENFKRDFGMPDIIKHIKPINYVPFCEEL